MPTPNVVPPIPPSGIPYFPGEYAPVVRFMKLHWAAQIPQRATIDSACLDLASLEDAWLSEEYPSVVIGTGIAMELPPGYVGLVCSRSGMAAKDQRFVLNAPGVIDADYRGEIKVILGCLPRNSYWPNAEKQLIPAGTRVAQLMILPLPLFTCVEVSTLTGTDRGEGGLGSTGA